MLSDRGISNELFGNSNQPTAERLVDSFPLEGPVKWGSLSSSDPLWASKDSPVQPASLDLHVGYIYVPGTEPDHLGAENRGATCFTIAPGHSVIVSTYEKLTIPSHLGGIVFPPSALSSKGILVANIGHIDPGFSGQLRFTIINMGGKEFPLERGRDTVATLLLFNLDKPCESSWGSRRPSAVTKGEPTRDELDSLSKDFADMEARISQVTKKTVNRMQFRFGLIAALLPIVLGIWTVWAATGQFLGNKIDANQTAIVELRERVAQTTASSSNDRVETQAQMRRLTEGLEEANRRISELNGRLLSPPQR